MSAVVDARLPDTLKQTWTYTPASAASPTSCLSKAKTTSQMRADGRPSTVAVARRAAPAKGVPGLPVPGLPLQCFLEGPQRLRPEDAVGRDAGRALKAGDSAFSSRLVLAVDACGCRKFGFACKTTGSVRAVSV